MVAACRALETGRPNGLTHDPFAENLAGDKGMALARNSLKAEWMRFGIGVRSRFIDDLLTGVLGQGDIETVVNLGAGLDTRPWRLDLPARLRWIEVDFQDILDYKAERLRAEPPRCTLEQVAADLSVSSDRERVFRAVGSRSALMLTEGLLMYLSKDALAALALEAVTNSGIRRWIFDISSNELMRRVHGDELKDIDSVRAKDHLTGSEIIEVALSHGWKTGELRSYTHDVITIARDRILELISSTGQPPEPPPENDPSGVYLLNHK